MPRTSLNPVEPLCVGESKSQYKVKPMCKDTISLIVAVISVGYILFANPAHAATPTAAPQGVTAERPLTNKPCRAGNTPDTAGAQNVVCLPGDKQRWLLLSAAEIHRLLTIHVTE